MNILNWLFFIASIIGYLISFIGSIISANDEERENALLWYFTNYLSIGLVFYTSIDILASNVALIVFWSTISISILLLMYAIYKSIYDYQSTILHKISTISILCVLIITAIASFRLDISNTMMNLTINSTHKQIIPITEIILIGWIPLIILLLIYWRIKQKTATITNYYEDNKKIEDIICQLYVMYRNYYEKHIPLEYVFEEAKIYIERKDINPETRQTILRNIGSCFDRKARRLISIREFRNILLYGYYNDPDYSFENTYLLETITERIQTILRKELNRGNGNNYTNFDNAQIHDISANIEDLKNLFLQNAKSLNNKDDINGSNNLSSFQQQFIKELFHCLMTPISQVDASLTTVKTKLSDITEDEDLARSLKSIKAGIELTKSVLYAYRQVAYYTFNNVSEDSLTIKEGIESAELLYQSHNTKQIIFNTVNIPESILGFSNYFVLATLLPLLENAIYATESSQQINIEYEYCKQDHIFKISNPCKTPINVKNLYKEGFSSKNEKGQPHKGTGLTIVRNLIGKNENSKLDFEYNDNILTAILKIHDNGNQ